MLEIQLTYSTLWIEILNTWNSIKLLFSSFILPFVVLIIFRNQSPISEEHNKQEILHFLPLSYSFHQLLRFLFDDGFTFCRELKHTLKNGVKCLLIHLSMSYEPNRTIELLGAAAVKNNELMFSYFPHLADYNNAGMIIRGIA